MFIILVSVVIYYFLRAACTIVIIIIMGYLHSHCYQCYYYYYYSDVKLIGTIYSDDKCRTIKYEKFILSYFPGQSNKCYDLSENISTIWTCHIWGGISPAITRYKFVPILHLLIVLISTIMCVFFQQ